MMTSTIRKFGVGVASIALVASAAAPAFAADDGNVLPGLGNVTMDRLWGADRIGTALKVADHAFRWNSDKPTTVYITNADDSHLIDSTTAGKLTDGPIVFVKNDSYVAEAVGAALKDEAGNSYSFGAFNKVVAIGGESSISDATLKTVAKKAGAAKTDRIAGKDRYETAVKIAEYIYAKAINKEDGYERVLANFYVGDGTGRLASTTNLAEVYIANGTDGHLVDSMVGGVLDHGPTLLAGPDGSLSEETQAFIKKTLPEQFIALGGEKAVSDKTVNDAWLIKALKNDWTDSSNIPSLKAAKERAEFLLNGARNGESRNPGSSDFMGLKKAVSEAVRVRDVWSTEYQRVRLNAGEALRDYLKVNPELTPAQLISAMMSASANGSGDLDKAVANMILLYGDAITDANPGGTTALTNLQKANLLKGAFSLRDGKVTGFDFGSFESFPAVADKVSDAKDDLIQWWGVDDVSADKISKKKKKEELSYIAIASQKESTGTALNSTWNNADNIIAPAPADVQKAAASAPLAAVKEVSAWVVEEVKKNRDAKQADFDAAAQALREGLDKVSPKTVLRLGGKDRYETAAYIATQYMKDKTYIANLPASGNWEFYVANGMAYADAIVAGQLRRGPVLLVPAEGDIPAAVSATAASLPAWNKGYKLAGYAIGGTRVMPEAQAAKVLDTVIKNITNKGNETVETIRADKATVTVNGSDIASAASPVIKAKFQVMDGKSKFDNTGSKIKDIKVYNSDNNLNAAVGAASATGEFTVDLDLTNATFGTYTVEYTIDGKMRKTSLEYKLGTPVEVADTNTAAGSVSYTVVDGSDYDGGKVYELKDNKLDLVSSASIASGVVTDAAVAAKTLVVMADGKPAKVVKTGKDLEKFATPANTAASSPVAKDGSEVELATITSFDATFASKLDSSAGNYLSNFDWEIVSVDLVDSNVADIEITKIEGDGKVLGKVKNPAQAGKKFKVKLTIKAKGDTLASDPAETSSEITIAS